MALRPVANVLARSGLGLGLGSALRANTRGRPCFAAQTWSASRLLAQPANSASSSSQASTPNRLVYEGPLSGPIRRLKLVSATSATLTFAFVPTSMLMGVDLWASGKAFMLGTVCLFAAATTAVLHLTTRGYVRKIFVATPEASSEAAPTRFSKIEIETLNMLGMPKRTLLDCARIEPASQTFGFDSFRYNQRGYFLHEELVNKNETLRLSLLPKPSQEPPASA
ncbi:uncharacterized protein MONBRDRAFT_23482 [Monosiga brevicollis MX1]|uniref:Transmembrane protein 186 n=1 Tax=Monosiga brevicollis TaxID=81824 RepID=A9UTJ5_MONBE|nr:uncharacterized protein MONBRDRAFT_23482 [Monosiga brevicollis MX1]EDQ91503.1 predicted protein [Monosiga brevicollis MX1]|eukprot:XP_001743925.1 hypothetical protein [Monosiga brevicollis MX1]